MSRPSLAGSSQERATHGWYATPPLRLPASHWSALRRLLERELGYFPPAGGRRASGRPGRLHSYWGSSARHEAAWAPSIHAARQSQHSSNSGCWTQKSRRCARQIIRTQRSRRNQVIRATTVRATRRIATPPKIPLVDRRETGPMDPRIDLVRTQCARQLEQQVRQTNTR